MMKIEIKKSDLKDSIKQEISRTAAGAYSEDGSSLYDGLKATSRDESMIDSKITEALIVVHSALIRFVENVDTDDTKISISMDLSSRRGQSKASIIPELVNNVMVNLVVSKYFLEKQQTKFAEEFDTLAAADIKLLTQQIYHKAAPSF